MKHLKGSGRLRKPERKKAEFRDLLNYYRDVLDAVIKTSVVLLPVSALQVYAYLRLIGHTELFASAALSAAGLSALLQATLLTWGAFIICTVAPSVLLTCFFTDSKSDGEGGGLWKLAGLTSFVWAIFYSACLGFFGFSGGIPGLWLMFWCVLAASGIASFAMALWSPSWLRVLNHSLRMPGHAHTTVVPKWLDCPDIVPLWKFLRRRRIGKSLAVAAGTVVAGLYSLFPIWTVYALADAYALPEKGWGAAALALCVVLVGILPGLVYLRNRASGAAGTRAFKHAGIAVGFVLAAMTVSGFLVQGLNVGTMRAMGIVDPNLRTYEITKPDEVQMYKMLLYRPHSDKQDNLVSASIAFQFGEVRFVCPNKLDFPRGWARHSEGQPAMINTTGCVNSSKGELRIVDLESSGR
ncbi:hypothetical protein [Paraburkholderia flagellata]|uniref:hypothetical protein n=1 Tax=Paraburkholderia flagellata TaxID=2883241 RepID=UPI001F295EC9|nr:hypothetical protein [Paraburkholderia flagellata]